LLLAGVLRCYFVGWRFHYITVGYICQEQRLFKKEKGRSKMNEEKIKSFKGFDKNLKCKGFQFEIGKEYEESDAKVCKQGFHACEQPIDVFSYYAPGSSRYCEVEQRGKIDREGNDSKVASSRIKVGAEIGILGIVKAQIEYVKSHTTTENIDPQMATAGFKGAATAGDYGAATAGNYGAATARGSSSVGKNGIACARGNGCKVKGGLGAVLVLVEEREVDCDINFWKAEVVDGIRIKENTFYKLKDGEFVEVVE
jgi:hypothetical protein